jgi:SAM-dependent methyltransferase
VTATAGARWPKRLPPLTAEQQRISDDFMRHWHEVLPRRYGVVESFNHSYPVRQAPRDFRRTLELGVGLGEHLAYEKLTPEQEREYVAVDIRPNMVEEFHRRHPRIRVLTADCQQRLPFEDGFFDRIVAVHILEHLPDLPAALREMHRLSDPQRGWVSAVIPCEGGLAYAAARRISAQRIFERRYRQPYRWLVEREHLNRPAEILAEIGKLFRITHRRFFPLLVPAVALNLCIGLTLRPQA